jgi:thioesterase domain-containing protein
MTDFLLVANAAVEHMVPVAHRMGVRFTEVERGRVVAEVPLDGNTNHVGTMYAGVLFTVAEVLGGALALTTFDSAEFYPILKDVQIRFRRLATTTIKASTSLDEDAIAAIATEAAANGKADYVLDAELTDTDGTVVATTHGVYQLRRHGS